MANVTEWIMCGLTAIYVIATIMILVSNSKSAKAAEKQIEESKLIQKQNAALQLLNQRINIYNILSEWVTIAKTLCRNDMHFKQSLPLLHAGIFNNAKDVELQSLKEQIVQLERELLKDGVTKEQGELIIEQINELNTYLFARKLSMMGQEEKVIELSEICFDIDYQIIKEFMDAYQIIVLNINNEMGLDKEWPYANRLKSATQRLLDENILEKMKAEMKEANLLSKDA